MSVVPFSPAPPLSEKVLLSRWRDNGAERWVSALLFLPADIKENNLTAKMILRPAAACIGDQSAAPDQVV